MSNIIYFFTIKTHLLLGETQEFLLYGLPEAKNHFILSSVPSPFFNTALIKYNDVKNAVD